MICENMLFSSRPPYLSIYIYIYALYIYVYVYIYILDIYIYILIYTYTFLIMLTCFYLINIFKLRLLLADQYFFPGGTFSLNKMNHCRFESDFYKFVSFIAKVAEGLTLEHLQ